MVNNPLSSVPNQPGSEYAYSQKPSVTDYSNPRTFLKQRLQTTSFPVGAEPESRVSTAARFVPSNSAVGEDWRVKVSLPDVGTFKTSPLLQPLRQTDNSVVFPITPAITLSHTASYDFMEPIHNNYPFPVYQNSNIDAITIAGEFPVQNEDDGMYWIAANHFFRSATKMFYGETSNKGAPPPLCKLNGYGDFVLNNIPVVLTMYTVDLQNTVDYIRAPVIAGTNAQTERYTWVPSNSSIQITVQPTYSRAKVESFSLDKFVNGDLLDKGFM
jgi:hypothetical protein